MTLDIDKEIRDTKLRLDLAATRVSRMDGRFELITQLRDVQLYMLARSPRSVADLIAGRG